MQEQIIKKLEELGKETHDARKSYEELKKSNDILVKDKISKIDEASEKTLKELEGLKASYEGQKKKIEQFEKEKYSFGVGSKNEDKSIYKEYSNAIDNFLRNREVPSVEIREKLSQVLMPKILKDSKNTDIKVFNTIVKPEGGYWIKPEMMTDTIERSFETSPVRQVANIQTTGANSIIFPIDDDDIEIQDARKEGSAGAKDETDTSEIGELEIQTQLMEAKPSATQTMIEDVTFDLQSYIMNKAERDFARKENTNFVVGNGAMRPKGFLTYPAWSVAGAYERGKLEQRETANSGVVAADDFFDLQSDLHEEYQPNAVWMALRKSFNAIRKLKDGQGQFLLEMTGFKNGFEMRVLGRPLFFASDMPAISAGNLAFAYGDFKIGYTIVDRLGITLLIDPYTKTNRVVFKMRKRVGGAVTRYDALKLLKIKA